MFAATLVACAATTDPAPLPTAPRPHVAAADATADFTVRLIGLRILDTAPSFGGTRVGGLSGIDYDAAADRYYLVSDDRSRHAPTRFYTARLAIDADGFHDVALQTVVTLLRPDGLPYAVDEADGEAIRFDATTNSVWWSSEGGRRVDAGRVSAVDPFVRRNALDGRALGEVPLDPMFRFGTPGRGPRGDLVFEGLSLSPDRQSLWVAMEAPLRQDGPVPTVASGAWTRLSLHRRAADGGFGALAAQYAYPVDPIPGGAWTSLHRQNGVSEVLAIDDDRLFVLERALTLGAGWRIRLYEAERTGATDVAAVDALAGAAFVPMTKRLVLDFDTLGVRIDNLEGLCFGPTLANGHRTLVLVSDDNFNPGETTQFLAFELVPR